MSSADFLDDDAFSNTSSGTLTMARNRRDPADSVPILLAEAAFEAVVSPEAKRSIAKDTVGALSIVVPTAGWVDPMGHVISGLNGGAFVMERPTTAKNGDDNLLATNFLSEGRTVAVITPIAKMIPAVVQTTASHHLVVPGLTMAMITAVIKKVAVGRPPADVDDLPIRSLSFEEVAACIGQGGNASAIVERLREAIARKTAPVDHGHDLPDLTDAVEYGAARQWAVDLKNDLDAVLRGELTWADVDRGAVLSSEPGMGKSLFSLALGKYLNVPVFQTSMSSLFAAGPGYLDSVVKALRGEFDKAKAAAPSILFIDEIDAIPSPDTSDTKHDTWWRTVSTDFLLQLDSAVSDRGGVIVVGATNRPHAIHPSITRPGRLERVIHIGPPDAAGSERVLRHHLKGDLAGVDIGDIAKAAAEAGATPAVMMEAVRSAKRAARNARRAIDHGDLMRRFKPAEDRSAQDIALVACHESGHALVAALTIPDAIVLTSIERLSDRSGGRLRLEMNGYIESRSQQMDRARVYLAGRAAELVVFGEASLGSGGDEGSDIARATAVLASLHLSHGAGDSLRWRSPPEHALVQLALYPATQATVEAELAELFEETVALLERHRLALDRLRADLAIRRTLYRESILQILAECRRADGGDVRRDRFVLPDKPPEGEMPS